MKQLNKKTEKIFRDLLSTIPEGETHIRLGEFGEAIMPLCIEKLYQMKMGKTTGDVWSFAHYFKQNGDMCKDPEMTFFVSPVGVVPMSFEMNGTVLEKYEVSVKEENGIFTGYLPKLQQQHTTFSNHWLLNLKQQFSKYLNTPTNPDPVTIENEKKEGIELVDYSPKAFALFGEGTRPIKDELYKRGGKFNWYLKREGQTTPGFIFSKNRLLEVKNFLSL